MVIKEIRIKHEGGFNTEIYIDGKRAYGVARCDVCFEPNELPKVTLEYNPLLVTLSSDSAEVNENK